MITGLHTLIYSSDADATRTFLRDTLGFKCVDAGEGWLIFRMPPAELGIHPAAGASGGEHHGEPQGTHALSLMCDNLEATVTDLKRKGVQFRGTPNDRGWGIVAILKVPGAGEMLLYQPRHKTAIG